MNTLSAIAEIEKTFGFKLPAHYRLFLTERSDDLVESIEIDALVDWARGPTATVDCLYSGKSILQNDASGCSCDRERRMLIIGYSVFGAYLYLCWAQEQLGRIFFREPFQDGTYYLVANSFKDFLARSRPIVYNDEA
ncbi:hypothetical protein C7S18_06240 [Ahniella affigens]|uniref:Knr4/Smi1-like domain-containing protein n=1 Tax=Ahniella affigens TaxID=2021234 RepID=A0A2P1PPQ7_9GAMM|nr:SMI1/KNR4 family protein [Ahniella affigens]AVP96825.1 hypothetical protein C7S18_06240 [Ahniella affigens]